MSDNLITPVDAVPSSGRTRQKLYVAVARRILKLVEERGLEEGDRLPAETELARALSVSRATVREALAALEVAGAIHVRPNTGAFLIDPGAPETADNRMASSAVDQLRAAVFITDDIADIAMMRTLVESEGARQSIAAGDVEWESGLVAAHHKLAHIESRMSDDQEKHYDLWRQCDWQFHEALLAASGSDLLKRMHRIMFDRFQDVVALEYQHMGYRGEVLVAEHRDILDAALDRDPGACAAALSRHLRIYDTSRAFSGS